MPTVLLTTPGAGTWTNPETAEIVATVELVGAGAQGGQGGDVNISDSALSSGVGGGNSTDTSFGTESAQSGRPGRGGKGNGDGGDGGDGGTAADGVDGEDGDNGSGSNSGSGGDSGSRDVVGLAAYGDGGRGTNGIDGKGGGGGGGGGAYRSIQNFRIAAGATVNYVVGASANETARAGLSVNRGSPGQGGAIRITYADPTPAAPNFSDDTGDAVTWVTGEAITTITVPQATGNPAPTYAVVGSLPTGIAFDVNTREITGTPSGTPSGTIRIRATNSQGTDDWTVAYTTNAAPPANVLRGVIGDGGTSQVGAEFEITPGLLIPAELVAGGGVAYLRYVYLRGDGLINLRTYTDGTTHWSLSLLAGPDLTQKAEQYAELLTIEAGDIKIVLPGPDAPNAVSPRDSTEPYAWRVTGAKNTELTNFRTAYRNLSQAQRNATRVTLRDASLALRISGRLEIGSIGSSQVDVENRTAISGRLPITGIGSSEVEVTNRTAISGRLEIAGVGASGVAVTQPTRISGRLNIGSIGSSRVDVQTFSSVVRMAGRLEVEGIGLSGVIVSNPDNVRLSGQLPITGIGSSGLGVNQPTRIAGRLMIQGIGEFTGIVVDQPDEVRLSSRLAIGSVGSSIVSVFVDRGNPEHRQRVDARALSGIGQVFALEAFHEDLPEPIRIVADNAEHIVEGNRYQICGFRADPPQSKEGEVRQAELSIDNVGEKLMKWVRVSKGGRGASIRVMSLIKPQEGESESTIDYEFEMDVGVTEATNEVVSVTLTDEPVVGRPSVTIRHDAETSPGLFEG